MSEIKNYFMYQESILEDLGEGVSRRILSYSDNMMVVEVHFEKGAIGAVHSHPHEQCTYVLDGIFEINVDGNKKILKAGDTIYEQPSIQHGAICLEAGRLLDVFTPKRSDFLK